MPGVGGRSSTYVIKRKRKRAHRQPAPSPNPVCLFRPLDPETLSFTSFIRNVRHNRRPTYITVADRDHHRLLAPQDHGSAGARPDTTTTVDAARTRGSARGGSQGGVDGRGSHAGPCVHDLTGGLAHPEDPAVPVRGRMGGNRQGGVREARREIRWPFGRSGSRWSPFDEDEREGEGERVVRVKLTRWRSRKRR